MDLLLTLGPFLIVTAGAVACLLLFFSLKKEIQELRVQFAERDVRLQGMLEDIERQMEGVNRKAWEAAGGASGLVTPAPPSPQKLHLHRPATQTALV